MKAVYATGTNYDDPLSVLEVGTMPEPETKPFWSTIRVNSASVNHHDVWSLQGVGLSDEQTPMILGTDAAGVLEEDIPVRKGLKAGSEVVLYTFVGTDGAGVMPGERRSILSERYAGTMQRSFYVGDAVTQEDVKAKFEDGILKLSLPKKNAKAVEANNSIAIEG